MAEIFGTEGADSLVGTDEADSIFGLDGGDTLVGSRGGVTPLSVAWGLILYYPLGIITGFLPEKEMILFRVIEVLVGVEQIRCLVISETTC
ncbi:hypothetical protein VB836_26515 [Limnoraphis robusta BA-68 BA1]|nr:hypothetical protein [Limnoraphis robusta]MEA5500774.1 hypothetical protein [Limnoraphis robusta BA-68 BA1]